jgi:hypothetical protein
VNYTAEEQGRGGKGKREKGDWYQRIIWTGGLKREKSEFRRIGVPKQLGTIPGRMVKVGGKGRKEGVFRGVNPFCLFSRTKNGRYSLSTLVMRIARDELFLKKTGEKRVVLGLFLNNNAQTTKTIIKLWRVGQESILTYFLQPILTEGIRNSGVVRILSVCGFAAHTQNAVLL